jgi:glycosyltransferase involved in cell wall biosynthesis
MRVSVVIPSYNCAKFVTEAVESVLGQTYPVHELLVIDDGSTDDTKVQLEPYANRIRYIWKENGGVSSARNRGIKESTGDLVAFLDADDVWHPRKLELQISCLQKHPEIGLIGAKTISWPDSTFPEIPTEIPELEKIPFENLVVQNYLGTSLIIIRREILDRVGEFDCQLRVAEDHDLWLRIARITEVANLPLRLGGYRHVVGSLSKHAQSMELGMRLVLNKLDASSAWNGKKSLRRRAYAYFHLSCGLTYYQAGLFREAASQFLQSLCRDPLPSNRKEVFHRIACWNYLGRSLWKCLIAVTRFRKENPI